MQHQTNYVLTFYIWFLSKLEKGKEMFYFIESHYNDFVHNSFNCSEKLKNGPLYSGHPKLSKFVRFFYMEI